MVEPRLPQAAARGRRHRGAEAEALLVALPARLVPDRRRRRRRHRGQRPPLLRQTSPTPSPTTTATSKLERLLANVDGGEPENILILGSDKRASEPDDPGRSDTTMLLRLDPDRNAIALMSIPRDLKVEIPGYGTEKFNAAYTYGGPETDPAGGQGTDRPADQPRRQRRLPRLRPRRLRDRLRLRRRRPPLLPLATRHRLRSNMRKSTSSPATSCSAAKRRCSTSATATPTPTWSARRASRTSSAPPASGCPIVDLFTDRDQLLDIFTEYTTSDISDGETVLEVLKLFIDSRNAEIHEVHFPAELGPSYVYATPEAIEGAVDEVPRHRSQRGLARDARRGARKPAGERQGEEEGEEEEEEEGEAARRGAEAAGQRRTRARPRSGRDRGQDRRPQGQRRLPGLLPDAAALGRGLRRKQPLPESPGPARLPLQGHRRQSPAAYRMVLSVDLSDGTHYFGVQGIRGWSDPPILSDPSETREIHGREYEIYIDGDRVERGRLAPRRQQLLDRQRPAQHPDQRPDARHGALGGRDRPEPRSRRRGRAAEWRRKMSRSG